EMLSQDIQLQSSGRGRFQRKLQLAQLCLASGHEALAHPILEQLSEIIDRHRLEEWESAEAVAHPLAMLYRCLNKVEADPGLRQKLYAQICRLDPVQALACGR
ncbi:MAG: ImpA domain protein, partial [Bryobacterales bacterium]|nr:ImpA domain protein [Bryobacterales bacterium]